MLRFLLYLLLTVYSANAVANFTANQEVKAFLDTMVIKHNFNKAQLYAIFSSYAPDNGIIEKISKPHEQLPWDQYKKLLITDARITSGVSFWYQHQNTLKAVEAKYGVPAEVIIAILGLETFYGKYQGNYPVIQALATLAFTYPPRAKFFKQELEEFLLLTKEQNLNPLTIKGSYAGAMGIPQFIASSYRNFAVGFQDNHSIDIINDTDSAIASVANYFKLHGWETNSKIMYKAHVSGDKYKKFISKVIEQPRYDLKILAANGVTTTKQLHTAAPLSLVEFNAGNKPEYWLAEKNFFVITRYNRSYNYAMAIFELSTKIKQRYENKLNT